MQTTANPVLKGVSVPIVTPFTQDGQVDHSAARRLVEHLIQAGVHGLMTAGTTGEGPLLSAEERMALAETVIEQAAGRVPVAVHVGAITTAETIRMARHAVAVHANTISAVCPYFFGLPEAAQINHYCQVAKAVPADFPVYLYNIPHRTMNNISATVSAGVANRCSNVVGEKDSSGDLKLLAEKLNTRRPYDLISGADQLVLSSLIMGAHAAIVMSANVVPGLWAALFTAYWAGDWPTAQQVQSRLSRAVTYLRGDIALIKAVCAAQGIPVGSVRSPLPAASPDSVATCLAQFKSEGFLDA